MQSCVLVRGVAGPCLTEESARTAQAIAAFEQLVQRLEELAAARRPSWRRSLRLIG